MKFDALGYGEVLTRDLKVADVTAITLCRDNKLPILVFELLTAGNIARAVKGEKIGTLVGDQGSRASTQGPGPASGNVRETPLEGMDRSPAGRTHRAGKTRDSAPATVQAGPTQDAQSMW
ncbi:Uridylate kinase [Streptomyces alboniger]